jgi:hypothetical protein
MDADLHLKQLEIHPDIQTMLHSAGSSLPLKTVLCGCYFYFELAQNKLVHVPDIFVNIIHFCYKSIKRLSYAFSKFPPPTWSRHFWMYRAQKVPELLLWK